MRKRECTGPKSKHFLFEAISSDTCSNKFVEFLGSVQCDLLSFGRSCKFSVGLICSVLEDSISQTCRETNKLKTIRDAFWERSLSKLPKSHIYDEDDDSIIQKLEYSFDLAADAKTFEHTLGLLEKTEKEYDSFLSDISQYRTYQILYQACKGHSTTRYRNSCISFQTLILRSCEFELVFKRKMTKNVKKTIEALKSEEQVAD